MTQNPLVSVVVPSYNCALYLKSCIDSVQNQTYQNWELILIDDASTDNTKEALEAYKQNPKIKIHHNPVNQGVGPSRNKGVELAQGEWIAFLDADDMWEPQKLAEQLEHIKATASNFSCTEITWIDENSKPLGAPQKMPERVTYKTLLKQNIIPMSTVMIRKVLLQEDQFENRGNEDFALWVRVLKRGEYCTVLKRPYTSYRFRPNSRSSQKLKSAYNNWLIYRDVAGLPFLDAALHMFHFTARSIKKYRRLNG